MTKAGAEEADVYAVERVPMRAGVERDGDIEKERQPQTLTSILHSSSPSSLSLSIYSLSLLEMRLRFVGERQPRHR